MASEKIHTHFLKIENIAARNFFYLHRKSAQVSHNSYFKQTLQEFFEVNITRFNSILYCFNISYHTKKISADLCETNSTNSSEGLIIFFCWKINTITWRCNFHATINLHGLIGVRLEMETRRKRNPSQSESGPKSKRPKRRNEISLSENKDNLGEGIHKQKLNFCMYL